MFDIFGTSRAITDSQTLYSNITVGEVIDTNDPQQMGRVRVFCPGFGDRPSTSIDLFPWCLYASPFGGFSDLEPRGREEAVSSGAVSYGMWAIPKIGSQVLVACIDGNTEYRVWFASLQGLFLPHTMPHGRYTYSKEQGLQDEPSGPFTSAETPIEPLYSQQTIAYTRATSEIVSETPTTTPRKNFEFRTRGADKQVAGVPNFYLNNCAGQQQETSCASHTLTKIADDSHVQFTEPDGKVIDSVQGYDISRVEKDEKASHTVEMLDPQVYALNTPGFHSLTMCDRQDNCRIRIRTTHGHQIIMDDTNERIYISTGQGKTWIEIDEKGNIDIYGERNVSVHAEKDINFTADQTIRMKAKQGVHIESDTEIRLHSKADTHVRADANIRVHSGGASYYEADGELHLYTHAGGYFTAGADINQKAGGMWAQTSGGTMNLLAGGQIIETGSQIHLNGPGAAAATAASPASEKQAFWTNRVPEHEPWARVMTKTGATDNDAGNTHVGAGEYPYNDPNVGRTERGDDLQRNPKWHR